MKLILASTSPYRRELLERLGIPFEVCSPKTDETALPGEAPEQMALRLAIAKAQAVAQDFPDALIIGSDQVATVDGLQLGKPLTHENALQQLRKVRGRAVLFHTALCLYNSQTGQFQTALVPCTVYFRNLDDTQIERYLTKEKPYQCAGSAKSEGLGIALIERMETDDPNALIGLPLIALVTMLEKAGMPAL